MSKEKLSVITDAPSLLTTQQAFKNEQCSHFWNKF